jgi:dihydrofolate reductase
MPPVCLVVAMAENRVIGRDGGLPWKISEDLRFFKRITMGKPILMGRKTYISIGRPLPGRSNIVITRDTNFTAHGVKVAHDLEAAIKLAQGENPAEIMIIGGAEIYGLALPRADRIYLTEVHADIEGDARFPEFDRNDWQEVAREDFSGDPAFSFVTLDRKHL